MKHYPEITNTIQYGLHCYCFDKLDGSNIRAEWSRKHKAFVKFGSRSRLLGADNPILMQAVALIKNKYEEDLSRIFIDNRFENVVCFFEFFGPNSFAGNHLETDKHDVVLFDINLYKRGLIGPKEFLKLCGSLHLPNLVHVGTVGKELELAVRSGLCEGITFEGVVCKSTILGKDRLPIMFKIKSNAWFDKLRNLCKGDENLFRKLS